MPNCCNGVMPQAASNLMILLEKGVTNCPNWGFMLLGATRCGLKKDNHFVRVSVAHCCSQEEMILHPRWYLVNTYSLHTHTYYTIYAYNT